jgi:hypothetical protein
MVERALAPRRTVLSVYQTELFGVLERAQKFVNLEQILLISGAFVEQMRDGYCRIVD